MLCEQCLCIVEATSEGMFMVDEWRYKHHANIKAFQNSAEAGCQLCLMFWYQLPDEVRGVLAKQDPDNTVGDTLHEVGSTVTYTIDEFLRDRGRYEVSVRFGNGVPPPDPRIYFVRADG